MQNNVQQNQKERRYLEALVLQGILLLLQSSEAPTPGGVPVKQRARMDTFREQKNNQKEKFGYDPF